MAIQLRFSVGTVGHALAKACDAVGVKAVAEALGRTPATVYDWYNPNRPQKLPNFSVEELQLVAGMVAAKGMPHYFGLLFGGSGGAPVPKPHSADLLHHLAFLGDLRGRTSGLLCQAMDRVGRKNSRRAAGLAAADVFGLRAGDLTPAEQTALIDALDAEILGLTAFRAALLTTSSAAALRVPASTPTPEPVG